MITCRRPAFVSPGKIYYSGNRDNVIGLTGIYLHVVYAPKDAIQKKCDDKKVICIFRHRTHTLNLSVMNFQSCVLFVHIYLFMIMFIFIKIKCHSFIKPSLS